MLFSSTVFLFLFLPIVCALYLLVRKELKDYVLLLASIFFYAWGEPRYVAVMLLTIIINYVGALWVANLNSKKKVWGFTLLLGERTKLNCSCSAAKLTLLLTILGDLSFLFYFKYFNFFVENINELFGGHIDFIKVIMPIGISFYTFQAISYVVDVYREEVEPQKNIYKLALYITLFPQLVAGPIVKYHDVADQIEHRTVDFEKVAYGVKRFIVGLAKKVLLANTLGAVADKVFNQPIDQLDCVTTWLGAICYTFQIYYDFSGYSDMAIGLGSIFGFKFLENFNYPYISHSITEFWRRWHISLSTWFREYIYIPLGGNRKGNLRCYANLFIVFLITGFWHGATWSFIVWGVWNAVFIIVEKAGRNMMQNIGTKRNPDEAAGNLLQRYDKATYLLAPLRHLYALLVVIIGWVIFRADTLSYAWQYLKTMFGLNSSGQPVYKLPYYIDNIEIIAMTAAIICSLPIFRGLLIDHGKKTVTVACVNVWLLSLFVLSISFLAAATYNPFIYFRF